MRQATVTFSSFNQETMNGAKEYAIWRYAGDGTAHYLGSCYRTIWKTWRVQDPKTAMSQEFASLAEARKFMKEKHA